MRRIPYDGDYNLATTQNHSCFGDATCPSAFQLGGGIKSSINASSIFLPSGLVELKMAITTTSSQDAQTSIVSVAVECVPFELDDAQCETPSCEQVSTFSATIDPELLQTQCPDQTTLPTSTEVQLSLPVTVGVGPVGAGELASSNHLITYTVDVVDKVVLNATHESNDINEVQEDLDLGVAAWRVELANELATPCNVDEHVSASESLAANGRVCIKVNSTKQDADDYVAFIESATLTNNDKGVSTVLVAGRSHGSSSTDEAYAGAFFNDAHLDGDLTDDYVDYLTFFIDPELRPAEGETASISLVMAVAYHHVATGRRVLAERTSMPMTMDAAGEDETVLDIGTTTPEHCASGDSSVDATLTFAGLAIDQWAPEPVLLAIKDAAGTVSEDQVRVNSVAREDDGAAVGVEISGVDEAGAEDIVDALVLDVSSADAASFRDFTVDGWGSYVRHQNETVLRRRIVLFSALNEWRLAGGRGRHLDCLH